MLHAHRRTARLLLTALALGLFCPLAAASQAAATTTSPGARPSAALATCPAGGELKQRTRRVKVLVRGAHGKRRRVSRRVKRWVCVADVTAPRRVTGISANAGDGQVVLTWKASEDEGGIAGYEIFRDGRYVVTIAATTFTDPALANGVAHQYRVFAVDMARNLSAPSGVVWAMPRAVPDRTPPGMPVGLSATPDPVGLSVTLRWTVPADNKGVVSYRVYRDGALVGVSPAPGFVDPDLSHRTEYHYSVVALDAAGNISQAPPAVSTYVS